MKHRTFTSGVAIGGRGQLPLVGFCYDQSEIYKSVGLN